MKDFPEMELGFRIIGAAYKVHNAMGPGLLESIYYEAMVLELTSAGIRAEPQKKYVPEYRGKPVGLFYADIVAEERVIIEIKSVNRISPVHRAQLLNYMHIAKLPVGYLINFRGTRLYFERMVCSEYQ